MTPVSAWQPERDDRRALKRIVGRLPPWAHDHPVAWQTLYVLSIAVVVAVVLVAFPLVRGDPPEWPQIALSTGAVAVVLARLFILPHRNPDR